MDHSDADLAISIASRVADLDAVARERLKPLPVVNVETMPARLPKPGPVPRAGGPSLDTECGLLYTSGTTGRPKGCVLTNFYYLNAGAWYRDLGGRVTFERGRDRILNPLPLFHMNCQAVTATCVILTARSEEHTSELQSRLHLVCRLLLEKKKKTKQITKNIKTTHITNLVGDTTHDQLRDNTKHRSNN